MQLNQIVMQPLGYDEKPRDNPAKGVRVKSPSRVRIPLSPPDRAAHVQTYQQRPVESAPALLHDCALSRVMCCGLESRAERTSRRITEDTDERRGGKTLLHFIWMFIVGILVGIIAKLIYPGAAHMGIILTGILGIVGFFVGGIIARLFNKPPEGTPVHPAGLVMSVIGSLIVLFIYNRVVI